MFGGVGAWRDTGTTFKRREVSKVFLEDGGSWQD